MSNATIATKGATMAQVRAQHGEYFNVSAAAALRSMAKGSAGHAARLSALVSALVGAALERAQSGNMPALDGVDAALDGIKGAEKVRIDNALSTVRALPARALHSEALPAYAAHASALVVQLSAMLAPPAAAPKAATEKMDWKARCAIAESALEQALADCEALRSALRATNGIEATSEAIEAIEA